MKHALSVAHAELLLDRMRLDPVTRIVDIGCGWGELLLRAVERAVGSDPVTDDGGSLVRGVGVDRRRRLPWTSSVTRFCRWPSWWM